MSESRTERGSIFICATFNCKNKVGFKFTWPTHDPYEFWNHPDEDVYTLDDGEPIE